MFALETTLGTRSRNLTKWKELENDFEPKLTFEETVAVLKKRIIDLEYKFMKRKNDVRTCMCAFINAETSTNKQINALNTYIKWNWKWEKGRISTSLTRSPYQQDSGLDRHNTQEMYREFNQKLASLNHPILLTQKHPAADKLPPRPRSAMPSGLRTLV